MSRFLSCLLLTLGALLLAACSLPSTPPDTVTDPTIRAVYARAVAGDGDALYRVSRMYGEGSHGFPLSEWYSSMALDEACELNQPQAVHDKAVEGWAGLRAQLTPLNARHATYREWQALEDGLVAMGRELGRAVALGDKRARTTLKTLDADLSCYRQLSRQERAHYVKCPSCGGWGTTSEWEDDSYYDSEGEYHSSSSLQTVQCWKCSGKGFVIW